MPEIAQEIFAMRILRQYLANEGLKEIKTDGLLDKADVRARLNDPRHRFYKKPHEYALSVCEFYECSRCKVAYFGGFVDCQAVADDDEEEHLDESDLFCTNCRLEAMGIRDQFFCKKHGLKHVQMKCDYCCAVATYRCRGNTFYCEGCHNDPKRLGKYCCGGNNKVKCPFGISHLAGRRGIPLAGCIICHSAAEACQPILTETKQEIHLKKVLEKNDKDLKMILESKRQARLHSRSARRNAVARGEAEPAPEDILSASSSGSSLGSIVFAEIPGERNMF